MVRVVAPAALLQAEVLSCAAAQMRNRGSQWSQRLRTAVGIKMLAQSGLASRCKCFKRRFLQSKTRVRAILRLHNFVAPTTRIGDAAPFYVISQLSRTSAGHRSRSPGPTHDC